MIDTPAQMAASLRARAQGVLTDHDDVDECAAMDETADRIQQSLDDWEAGWHTGERVGYRAGLRYGVLCGVTLMALLSAAATLGTRYLAGCGL